MLSAWDDVDEIDDYEFSSDRQIDDALLQLDNNEAEDLLNDDDDYEFYQDTDDDEDYDDGNASMFFGTPDDEYSQYRWRKRNRHDRISRKKSRNTHRHLN